MTNETTPAHEPVRRPLWRGSQLVRALWLDATLLGEASARMRVLAMWEPGARAYRLQGGSHGGPPASAGDAPVDGYVVEWPRARRLQCERAGGMPLCEQDGVLASAPLDDHERAGFARGSAVLVLGGVAHAYALGPAQRVDPSRWLGLAGIAVCVPLAMPRSHAATDLARAESVLPVAADLRDIFGASVPPPSRAQAEFLQRAKAARAGRDGAVRGAGAAAAGVAGVVGGLAMMVAGLFRGAGRKGRAGGGGTRAEAPGRLDRLAELTRLTRVLGWRQARFLRDVVRQFEEGNLDEALRNAIPLGGDGEPGQRAWGLPNRRGALTVTGRGGGGGSIGLDLDSMAFLRQTYENSFKALDRAGRIDEAAFVLAELLQRGREAVDYLEQKGRFVQAAQMAATLELDPAVAVRLYCLAGDIARAVRLARLTQSFAAAVAELERRQHPSAAALRAEWAESLAARGSPVEAAMALWPLQDRRERALEWLQLAEQAGGELGVQGLLYRLALVPDAAPETDGALRRLLADDGADAARLRLRAAECLPAIDVRNALTRRVAAALWRRALGDRAAGHPAATAAQLDKLLKLADDPLLAIDVPKQALADAPAATPLKARKETLALRFDEYGLLPLADVRRLPDGGYLLALGEQGVVLAGPDGRERCRFPAPADHLVLAATGQRALALARREKATRVSRIDLAQRRVTPWFGAELEFWADEYDGATWNVVAGQRLLALDCAAAQQAVLWQIGDLPGRIVALAQRGTGQALLLRTGPGTFEQWRYVLPQRRLAQRDDFQPDEDGYLVFPDPGADQPLLLRWTDLKNEVDVQELVLPRCRHGAGGTAVLAASAGPHDTAVHDGLVIVTTNDGGDWEATVIDFDARILATIELPGAREPRAAVHGGHLLAWDRRGRLVDVDLGTGAVRQLTLG